MSSPPSRPSPRDTGPQRQTRIRLERKVSLKFKDLEGFVTELSENISMGGMFLRTFEPPAPGTLFDFELTLEEEGSLIQGIAEVVWVREQAEGPRHPAGMGVRFLELAPGSRALIYQVVDEHIVAGGEPFDLGGATPIPPASAATAGSDRGTRTGTPTVRAGSYAVLASPQRRKAEEGDRGWRAGYRPPGGSRRGSRRWALVAGAVALVAIGVWTLFWGLPAGDTETGALSSTAEAPGDGAPPQSSPPRDRLDAVVPDPAGASEDAGSREDAGPQRDVAPAETLQVDRDGPAGNDDEAAGRDEPSDEPLEETGGADAGLPEAAKPDEPRERTPEPEPAAEPVATALEDITWRRQGETLVVTLTMDGTLFPERWDRFRMDQGTPREVIRIQGIHQRHRPSIPVGEPELLRIRTGLHRTARGNELHVVLDLGSPKVRLLDGESDGRWLHLTLFEGG